MNCPYCAERVADDAIVCKHCHRELFLIRPLMDKLADATRRLQAFEMAPSNEAVRVTKPARRPSFLPTLTPLSALSLMFIALMLAHFLLIVEYNRPLILLRAVSILVPLMFGFLYEETPGRTLLVEFICGVLVAVAAIFTMAAVIGRLDHVPVLPTDRYEWREFIEYGASIAFGFFTGVIIRHAVIAMYAPADRPSRLVSRVWRSLAQRDGKIAGIGLKQFWPILRTAAAIGSGIVSITTGFKQFF
jgi:hypothetical protein